MKIFEPLLDRVLKWSRHPHAERYLALVSFLESSVFPVPTALMLAPMVLAQKQNAWRLAALATITSVLGGVAGYAIGYFLFEQIGRPLLEFYNAQSAFVGLRSQFLQYGAWWVLVSGVTPVPYKIFTIASGVMTLPLGLFIACSIVGRGLQFFIVAGVLWWGGDMIHSQLRKWSEVLGWATALAALAATLYFLN